MHLLVVVDSTFRFGGGGEMLEMERPRFVPRPLLMMNALNHKGRPRKEERKEAGW